MATTVAEYGCIVLSTTGARDSVKLLILGKYVYKAEKVTMKGGSM